MVGVKAVITFAAALDSSVGDVSAPCREFERSLTVKKVLVCRARAHEYKLYCQRVILGHISLSSAIEGPMSVIFLVFCYFKKMDFR